jgi:chromate transporter
MSPEAMINTVPSNQPPLPMEPAVGGIAEMALPASRSARLLYLAAQFLKIGAIGFGGGMAVIALIERECVRRRKCVEADEFLHGVGLGQILGPFAVNAVLFVGYRMAGFLGGLVAATAFMLPSVVLVIVLSWLYFTFHSIPSLQGALAGVGPVVIALIVSAAIAMGTKAVRSWTGALLAALACSASLLHTNPVWILAVAGVTGLLLKPERNARMTSLSTSTDAKALAVPMAIMGSSKSLAVSPVLAGSTISAVATIPAAGVLGLAVTFLKIGLVFFGGGFVLIPILHHRLVGDLGWLTRQEFMDGVAISQLTPGPIAVLATFAGYRVGGVLGAIAATAALFAPAIVLMLVISRYYQRLRNIVVVKDFLSGIVPAVVGLIIAAAIALAPGSLSLHRPATIILAILALLALWRWKWHPAIVLGIGAIVGAALPIWFD